MSDYFEQEYTEIEDTQKDNYLTFLVEDEQYGVEIQYVTEIIGLQKISQVPRQPSCVRGIINLRGKIIPTIDIRLRFNMCEREYDDRTCIIVLDIHSTGIGIIVDRVSEVVTIEESLMSNPPDIMQGNTAQIMKGIGQIGNDVVMILSTENIVSKEELNQIKKMN